MNLTKRLLYIGREERMFGVELADELRGIVREPTALLFSVLMPVGFFASRMWQTRPLTSMRSARPNAGLKRATP